MSLPLPGTLEASMKRMGAQGQFALVLVGAEDLGEVFGVHSHPVAPAFGDDQGGVAEDGADLLFQASAAGLSGVITDDVHQGRLGDLALGFVQPGQFPLAPHQIAFGDLHLFFR